MYILGISAYYHDSAAALIKDGSIIAASQEERFTRKKHDPSFPAKAVDFCISKAGIKIEEIDKIVFYDKPLLKFERLLETYLNEAPSGLRSFCMAIPVWLKEKLFLKDKLAEELAALKKDKNIKKSSLKSQIYEKLLFTEHHISHAASAFYPSPYKDAAILTVDGVGEWSTTAVSHGRDNNIRILREISFPHSLGLLYSAFTYYTGFKVNSGEYKLMGLAPYGRPLYTDLIKDNLIDIKDDGSFKLNLKYFDFKTGLRMTNQAFDKLFNYAKRKKESELEQIHMDIAASIQKVTEEVILKSAVFAKKLTGSSCLCLAGGVALNCVANGFLQRADIFDSIWIQPAAGDAGGALGAALHVWFSDMKNSRTPQIPDMMKGALLGPEFTDSFTDESLKKLDAQYEYIDNENKLIKMTASALQQGKVVGWHQGKMEFGPRALGNRSILGDARSSKMQKTMNLKIKYRESFRPFAPSVLSENVSEWFETDKPSPYMLIVSDVKKEKRAELPDNYSELFGLEKLNIPRSSIPAVTHIDFSARVQTVHKETNPRYHRLISEFRELTDCPVLVNTSFNVRGEPIVCTPEDAYRCFMRTEMDMLVIGNFVLFKDKQISRNESDKWKEEFELD